MSETLSPQSDRRILRRPPGWLVLAKLAIAGGLMAWVLRSTPLADVWTAMSSADVPLVVASFAILVATIACSTTRWRMLLRAQGVAASYPYLVKSFIVGIFFNNLLPSTMGGDTVRAYDSWRAGAGRTQALAVIVVDRLLGMAALMVLALCSISLAERWSQDLASLGLWLGAGIGGFLCAGWLFLSPSPRAASVLARMRLPLPRRVREIAAKFLTALGGFEQRKGTLLRGFLVSVVLQILVVIHYYLIARALDLPIPFTSFFLIVPLALVVMLVPVSINAIGVRENVFAFFFAAYGVTKAEAVAFAWVAYGMLLFEATVGAMLYTLRLRPSADAGTDPGAVLEPAAGSPAATKVEPS